MGHTCSNKWITCYVRLVNALTNYLSALNYPNEKDELYKFLASRFHVIGKDICDFMLLARISSSRILSLKRVYGHGWILSEIKNVKSKGNILDQLIINTMD